MSKQQEIVTVEFTRTNNIGSTKILKEFTRSTAEKGIKSKASIWKNARIITEPVEVDLGLKKKESKTEAEPANEESKTEAKPKKVEETDESHTTGNEE